MISRAAGGVASARPDLGGNVRRGRSKENCHRRQSLWLERSANTAHDARASVRLSKRR